MQLKPNVKENLIKALKKVMEQENISDISLDSLSDRELKDLYLKLQALKSGKCYYGLRKGNDFEEDLKNDELQFISFRDTFKFGVRPLTFKEFLILDDYSKNNPSSPYQNILRP